MNMLFCSFKPAAFLSGFVENLWLYEGYEAEHTNERILPSGTIELVVNLREGELRIYRTDQSENCSRYSGAVVSGPYKHGFLSDTEEEAFIMGVHFRPGGAFPFLGVPSDELADAHVDLDVLWGNSAGILREELCEAASSMERFTILQDALVSHISRPMEHHYAVSSALDIWDGQKDRSVRDISKDLGLSQRRFIEVFRSEVGMTPKVFNRIQRFQAARNIIERTEDPDWAAIAYQLGYFDQSHLIREFKEFSGTSPDAYLRQHGCFIEGEVHLKTNHLPCV